jgi:predicted NAD/FAD-dependent oxidoreductase
MHIAIIGAGIAGLTCARKLQAQGNTVVVYEQSADVSGRMSTRETEVGGFDHGAQYFTATSERFKKEVTIWRNAGWIAPWEATLVNLDRGTCKAVEHSPQRLVGVPGMNALARLLAQGLKVRSDHRVKRIEQYGDQWTLAVQTDTVAIDAAAGPFDAVVIAVTADQAIPLLQSVPGFAQQAEHARCAPCWTLMLAFQHELGLEYDGAWVENSRLGWICRDASKPQRRPGEHWVGHATVPWSIEHLEDDPERAKEKLLKAFHDATGSHVQPVYAVAHRWRYAQATRPLAADCLWDGKLRIGACGDWFAAGLEGGGRVENAYLSACALADAIG